MNRVLIVLLAMLLSPALAQADEVGIAKGLMAFTVETEDGPVEIKRNQDQSATINPDYAKTSRKCPPFCVQPHEVAPGVKTIGELEMLYFIKDKEGILIDARTESWHVKGTIPGSKNIPFTLIAGRLDELGCVKKDNKWDCAGAELVAMYCNGLWCGQSPMAIRAMLREGYPADKILYYRNGMNGWESIGLTVVEGGL